MYITAVPNGRSAPSILLRESYRKDGRVKNRTLANLSHWEPGRIEALRQVLKGQVVSLAKPLDQAFDIVRSLPHGHVAAVLGTLRRLGLERIIDPKKSRQRDLVVALIVSRMLWPSSKLATARCLGPKTQNSTLGELMGLGSLDEEDLYGAMDWLLVRQERIEKALAKRHLQEGKPALYDVTSSYFEGRKCPLGRRGYSRDGRQGTLQIVLGLLANPKGCPVAVEVFEGNTGDPKTVKTQVDKLQKRFGLNRVILVGDRGMLTEARVREDLKEAGLDWITTLRAPQLRKLVESGPVQLSLFDDKDLVELESPEYPGERLVVCRNPVLAAERARKRKELLEATESELAKVVEATKKARRPLRGAAKIGLRVGRVLGRYKMAKHFRLEIQEEGLSYERDEQSIERESRLDGLYVVRTPVPGSQMPSEEVVRCYKQLATVERAFRSLKTVDLKLRPIGHYKAERVKAHALLCMLAYYVQWHMRQDLAPLLFDDTDPAGAKAQRSSVVAPAKPSPRARAKARSQRTEEGYPVHSFQTLLRDLATVVKNRVKPKDSAVEAFDIITQPTLLQARAFELLRLRL